MSSRSDSRVPGSSSRLYGPVAEVVGSRFAATDEAHPRYLWHPMGADSIIHCQGFDIPELVASEAVDIGITGYDVCVECCLAKGEPRHPRVASGSTSFVTY